MKTVAALLMAWACFGQDRVNPDALVIEHFEKRVADYVDLQKSLAKGLPEPKPTVEPQVIIDHQHELAKRIRAARHRATQGDIFTPEISKEFRRLLGFAKEGQNDSHIKKSLERAEP